MSKSEIFTVVRFAEVLLIRGCYWETKTLMYIHGGFTRQCSVGVSLFKDI